MGATPWAQAARASRAASVAALSCKHEASCCFKFGTHDLVQPVAELGHQVGVGGDAEEAADRR